MPRIFRTLAPVLVLILLISACAGSGSKAPSYNDSYEPPGDTDYPDNTGGMVRQIIYEINVNLEVADINQGISTISQKANELGGYVASSVQDAGNKSPTARITFRIPQAKYQEFLAYVKSQGTSNWEAINSTDVTEEFVDLEARLANRKAHEERLLAILNQTGTFDELLSLERELARIREDIEVIQGRLRFLGERTAMAKVEIFLTQAPGETDIPGVKPVGLRETLRRALRALVTSFTLFLDVLSFLLIAIAALLPFAIPVALILLFIYYRRRRRKNTSKEM